MDGSVEAILAEYERRAEDEAWLMRSLPVEEGMRRRDEFLISVGRNTGTLLNLLAREHGARTILEVGTAYGYSTVWLAEAARATGGKVISLEIHPDKVTYARSMLRRAGLAECVEFRLGDARESIAALNGPFDFVLLDLWKELYIPCFDLIYPKLAAGALIAADNMIDPPAHRAEARAYREHVRAKGTLDSLLLAVGSGVELSRYRDA